MASHSLPPSDFTVTLTFMVPAQTPPILSLSPLPSLHRCLPYRHSCSPPCSSNGCTRTLGSPPPSPPLLPTTPRQRMTMPPLLNHSLPCPPTSYHPSHP